MTYCFAFKLGPDGVGVIADQRITSVSNYDGLTIENDSTLKIYKIHDHGLIAIAGNEKGLSLLLVDLPEQIGRLLTSQRFDFFITYCKESYRKLVMSGAIHAGQRGSVSVIYADGRRHHSKNKYRLVAIELDFDGVNIDVSYRPQNGESFVDIGWFPQGRKLLSDAAMKAIHELEGRSSNYELLPGNNLHASLTEMGLPSDICKNTQIAYKVNSAGTRDSSFRKEGRDFLHTHKELLKHPNFQLGPLFEYSAAAESAILCEVARLRFHQASYIESIGTSWTLATLTVQRGVFIHPEGEVSGIFKS
jgi:hypothetical protein